MDSVWKELHSNYGKQSWVEKPSLFAEEAASYFPEGGSLLELGAGHGQDSLFFAEQGYQVVSTDIEIANLSRNVKGKERIRVAELNLKDPLPFSDNSFDVVYAHLSLHYFNKKTTEDILQEIRRILKQGGVFAFLANSINDPEYRTGTEIEEDFFQIDKVTKRYFSVETAKRFAEKFQAVLVDDQGKTYKDQAKGISNLIRFIGTKI